MVRYVTRFRSVANARLQGAAGTAGTAGASPAAADARTGWISASARRWRILAAVGGTGLEAPQQEAVQEHRERGRERMGVDPGRQLAGRHAGPDQHLADRHGLIATAGQHGADGGIGRGARPLQDQQRRHVRLAELTPPACPGRTRCRSRAARPAFAPARGASRARPRPGRWSARRWPGTGPPCPGSTCRSRPRTIRSRGRRPRSSRRGTPSRRTRGSPTPRSGSGRRARGRA